MSEESAPPEAEGELTVPDETAIDTLDVEELESAPLEEIDVPVAAPAELASGVPETPRPKPGGRRRRRRRGRRRGRQQPGSGGPDQANPQAKPPGDSSNEQ
jgi:hypothetical protein